MLESDITAFMQSSEKDKTFYPEIKLNEDISAPIAENSILGTATYNIDGETYVKNILAAHNVEKQDNLIIYLSICFALIIVILILSVGFKIKRKK